MQGPALAEQGSVRSVARPPRPSLQAWREWWSLEGYRRGERGGAWKAPGSQCLASIPSLPPHYWELVPRKHVAITGEGQLGPGLGRKALRGHSHRSLRCHLPMGLEQ